MTSAFQSQATPSSTSYLPPNVRPVAKAIHTPEPSTTAKWVPINRSFIALVKIILCSAQERLGLANLAITLRCVTQQGYKHLILINNDQDIQLTAAGRIEEIIISTDMPMSPASERLDAQNAITLPVDLNLQRLGYLVATMHDNPETTSEARVLAEQLGSVNDEFIGIVKRYQTRYRAIYVYGDQCYWIGNSQTLRQLDQQIGRLASTGKPVLLLGNKGTGKIIAARALHCERHTAMVPFIESNCTEWQAGATKNILQALYSYTDGGSLFLRNIDTLPESELSILRTFVTQAVNRALANIQRPPVDLIISLSHREAALSPDLKHWLTTTCCPLRLPDLEERVTDIRDLLRFFVRDHSRQYDVRLSDQTWLRLENTPWQGNVSDLQTLIEKAVSLAESKVIDDSIIDQCLTDAVIA